MKKLALISLVVLGSCSSRHVTSTGNPSNAAVTINGKLFATAWQQSAAEYRALCLQAFNIAQLRLDEYQPATNKPKAIITDIDETILNNSPYEAHQTLQNKDYDPASWYEWTGQATADTVPGGA